MEIMLMNQKKRKKKGGSSTFWRLPNEIREVVRIAGRLVDLLLGRRLRSDRLRGKKVSRNHRHAAQTGAAWRAFRVMAIRCIVLVAGRGFLFLLSRTVVCAHLYFCCPAEQVAGAGLDQRDGQQQTEEDGQGFHGCKDKRNWDGNPEVLSLLLPSSGCSPPVAGCTGLRVVPALLVV